MFFHRRCRWPHITALRLLRRVQTVLKGDRTVLVIPVQDDRPFDRPRSVRR